MDRVVNDGRAIRSTQICTPHQPYLLGSPSAVSSNTSGECIAAGTLRMFDDSIGEIRLSWLLAKCESMLMLAAECMMQKCHWPWQATLSTM